jgi:hypothetical protein
MGLNGKNLVIIIDEVLIDSGIKKARPSSRRFDTETINIST